MVYGRNEQHIGSEQEKGYLNELQEMRLSGEIFNSSKKGSGGSHEPQSRWSVLSEFSLFDKLRILPAVIILAFALVLVRMPNLFNDSGRAWRDTKVVGLGEAQAQAKKSTTEQEKQASNKKKKSSEKRNRTADRQEKPLDPVLFTRSEIELLQELSRRRKELDLREQTIVQREGLLMAAETRLEARINELETVKSDIETLITKYDAQEEEKFRGLVAIYEKMKPKESARIFDELDIEILLGVFERMKASKSASIIAKMKPERAKEITSRIADRREMPKLN